MTIESTEKVGRRLRGVGLYRLSYHFRWCEDAEPATLEDHYVQRLATWQHSAGAADDFLVDVYEYESVVCNVGVDLVLTWQAVELPYHRLVKELERIPVNVPQWLELRSAFRVTGQNLDTGAFFDMPL